MTTTTDSATLTSSTPAHQDPTAELDAASRELAAAVLDLLRALDRDDPCAITKRELAVRSIGRDLAARGEGLAECLASVRAGGRMVWPHLVATTRDKQRLGLIGSLLWETVDRVSELVAAGHHEASAARGTSTSSVARSSGVR